MASFRIADATFFQPYLYKEQIIAIYMLSSGNKQRRYGYGDQTR